MNGGGTAGDSIKDVAVDASGKIVAVGSFFYDGDVSGATATFGNVALSNAGRADAVVWKTGASGSTLWAVSGGGTEHDGLYGVAVVGRCRLT